MPQPPTRRRKPITGKDIYITTLHGRTAVGVLATLKGRKAILWQRVEGKEGRPAVELWCEDWSA